MSFSDRDMRRLRTASLLIATRPFDSVGDVARWFGAMQAQDYASGVWSLGLRVPGADLVGVESAIADGTVLRTWPMRGTLHVIASEDARWLLDLTGRRALTGLDSRWNALGLDATIVARATTFLAEHLAGRRMARPDVLAALDAAGINTSGQRGYHLLWHAAQTGVICVGPNEGKQQTYALLDDWAPQQRALVGEAALAELAKRYFQSHGPTTRQDFAGWAGITAGDAKAGIAAAAGLASGLHGDREVWFAASLPDDAASIVAGADRNAVRLMPGFDEFLLGYKDRSLPVPAAFADRIVPGNNGVFQPTIVRDGVVIGTWRRAAKRDRVEVTLSPFAPPSAAVRRGIEQGAAAYAAFLGLDLKLIA